MEWQTMTDVEVDSRLAIAVALFKRGKSHDLWLLLADRHIGPIQRALVERAWAWGFRVRCHLGDPVTGVSRQLHGDSCGYNSATDLMSFLQQPEGPWWSVPGGACAWEPHQASTAEIADANAFLQTFSPHRADDWPLHGGVGGACLLEAEDVFALCGRAGGAPNNDPSNIPGFAGVLPWNVALFNLCTARTCKFRLSIKVSWPVRTSARHLSRDFPGPRKGSARRAPKRPGQTPPEIRFRREPSPPLGVTEGVWARARPSHSGAQEKCLEGPRVEVLLC